ncbi:MAG: nicotinate-nicotinamide nucleotide adenylyltransferase [Actinomycetota bacterium]
MAAPRRDLIDLLRREGPPRLELLTPAPVPAPRVVGLLSGSFDPPTVAHAALASGLRDARCDLVLLVWSVRTLPKEAAPGGEPGPPLLDEDARLDCLLAMAAARPGVGLALSSHGLIADQVEAAARRFPGARLVVGMGSDKVLQLLDPRWYDDRSAALDRLTGLATVAYAPRAGEEEAVAEVLARSENAPWRGAFADLGLPPGVADVSSREVRWRLRAGGDVSHLLPPEVAESMGSLPRPEG